MAYNGFFDAFNMILSIKLFIFSIAAAFSDFWHPAFYENSVNGPVAVTMVTVFIGMLLAIGNVIIMGLTLLVTEAVRQIAMFTSGACVFFYALAMLAFSSSLAGLASPWMLAMLPSVLTVLGAHQILIMLGKLDNNCPLYKLAASAVMLLMCLLSLSLRHWWSGGVNISPDLPTVGLFSLPTTGSASALQATIICAFLSLLALCILSGILLAAARSWLSSNPLGDRMSAYIFVGLAGAALFFVIIALGAYSSVSAYTNSLLAAVCLSDAAVALLYQLFSANALTLQ